MTIPLSTKLRPETLDDLIGQEHLTAPGAPIHLMIERKKPLSFLLWGPPGCGKTSLARLFAKQFDLPFFPMSAAQDSIASIKALVKEKKESPLFFQKPLVFVDEIHRFSRLQQDAFLPLVEEGTILLIAATTENPSFALNGALLSRLRLFTLRSLNQEALLTLLRKTIEKENLSPFTEAEEKELIFLSQGDGRALINLIEEKMALGTLQETHRKIVYDKSEDQHYNLISALHKSIRTSDADSTLYWLSRMIQGGEDPHFLFRRLTRAAMEDIGLADPEALSIVIAAQDAYTRLGSPEGDIALAQAALYLALAPKSAGLYKAFKESMHLAGQSGYLPPPKRFLNSPTQMMKEEGYGGGYIYDHDLPSGIAPQSGLPDELEAPHFYQPTDRGFERELKRRLDYIASLKEENRYPK